MSSSLAHEQRLFRRRDLGVMGLALGFAALVTSPIAAAQGPIVRGFTLTPFDAVRLMTGEMFPPSDPSNLAVRVYQPENSLLDGSYKIPPVTRVRSA